ncbi:unnamed protein product [Caenorhabditis sp. 36 PRJEB53466]|nr:unnamed protein product [Caenorhabditis sp. 36 PRJEB53466]
MKSTFLFFSVLLASFERATSYNYLVFCPLYAHSHHKFLAKIADTLTDAGHNVTFLAPIILRKYENVKYLDSTKELIYVQPDKDLEALGVSADYSMFWTEDASIFAMVPAIKGFMSMFHKIYENFKNDLSLLDELKERKYDAMVFEMLCPTAIPIAEYLGIRTLLPTLSMTHHPMMSRWIGEPASPAVLPSMISPFGDDMNFGERLSNTLGDVFFNIFMNPQPMYSYKYPYGEVDLKAASIRAPFLFMNANPYLDYPRPLLTKTVLIGGISVNTTHIREEKLPEKYNEILNERKKTVLISFGSMIFSKDMPDTYKKTIVRVVESFPDVTFIWKYESEDVRFAKNLNNLYFSKWVPQTALLADKRLSAFVTHAGLGSVTELSYMGKPAILIPIFADQLRNAKTLSRHKGSITLDKRDLNEFEKLRGAVDSILNVQSYKDHAETLGHQLEIFCPLFAHSHHKYLAKIADTLSEAGHNVTFLAPIIVREYEKVKYLEKTTDIIYIQPDEELEKLGESADYSRFWHEEFGVFSMIPAVQKFYKMFFKVYENIKNDLSVLDELKGRQYDAMIFESLSFCAHPIGEYLGIKAMFPSFSMTHFSDLLKAIGEPSSTSFLPSTVSPFGDRMTFNERLMNTIGDFTFSNIIRPPTMTSFTDHNSIIDTDERESRAPFVFVNSNPFLDFPRPTLTKTVPIGGISVNVTAMREEVLPAEYDEVLDRRAKNALISFGSMMQSKDMPADYKKNIVEVMRSFPDVTFIWKYESKDVSFADGLNNVYFAKWVPQTALLADPRLSAFITHAGLGSVNELSYMGKPAILIPIFADQPRNAKMLARHNGSIALNKKDLADFDKLRGAVDSILNVDSYRENARALGQQLENPPISPRDLLVKHAEFGAQFGELPSLDPYYRKMSFFTFFLIDIIAFLFFCLIAVIASFVYSIHVVRRLLRRFYCYFLVAMLVYTLLDPST